MPVGYVLGDSEAVIPSKQHLDVLSTLAAIASSAARGEVPFVICPASRNRPKVIYLEFHIAGVGATKGTPESITFQDLPTQFVG